MVRNARLALFATVAVAITSGVAHAGSVNSYSNGTPSVSSYTAAVPVTPQMQPYYAQVPVAEPKDGYYDESKGNNETFGYKQSSACGGVLDGEKCLVILHDHMRRVRLDRPAGTILVGNPIIADVTVLGNDTMFVSARSIGSTNIIVLDDNGNEIVTYEVFVKEPKTKRVVLRTGGFAANYQCTPDCQRALTQSDDPQHYNAVAGQIGSDISLDQQAVGMQAGSNPNATPSEAPGPAPQSGGGAPAQKVGAAVIPVQSNLRSGASGDGPDDTGGDTVPN